MFPYITFIVIISSLVFMSVLVNKNSRVECFLNVSIFICCVLFLGLRYNVGVDYINYYTYMERLINDDVIFYKEPFFDLSVMLIDFLGVDLRYTFFLLALFFLLPFFLSLKYWSKNYALGMLLFISLPTFYLAGFNSVRQFIAVGFFVFALKYIYERDFLKYIFTILLGFFFHKSIIFVAPLYFFIHKSFKPRMLVIFVVFYFLIMKFALSSILSSLGFMDKLLEFENEGANLKGLVFVFLCVLVYLFKEKYESKYRDFNIISNLLFIASVISITPLLIPSLPSSTILRMSSYFTPSLIFYLSAFPYLFKGMYIRLIIIIMIILMSFAYYFQVLIYSGERLLLIPYKVFIHL